MTDTCTHRRSRLATPLALVLGAVLVSGTSAYAAATITGAQIQNNTVGTLDITNDSLTYADIKDGYVIGNDLQNETVTGGKIRNGTVTAADLAPGVANKLVSVRTSAYQSPKLGASTEDWQWAMPASELLTYAVTGPQVFTATGVVGYVGANTKVYDVAVCASVNGGPVSFAGVSYGTISIPTGIRVNAPVQAARSQSAGTLTLGPCVRGQFGGADQLVEENSAITVLVTSA